MSVPLVPGRRSRLRSVFAVIATLAVVFTALVAPVAAPPAAAADGSDFDPEHIIDDALFYDGAAMTAAEIQSFLDSKIGSCNSSDCINILRASVSSRPARYSGTTGNLVCDAFDGGTNLRISEIIYRAQVACGISAKVILVTLQKEQGLVTSKNPSAWNLNQAMGHACPDTAPCDPSYSGIGVQIISGTTQLKTYKAARFARQPGVHTIGFNPKSSCGSTRLTIRNYATAALYNYTPYQPNAAALRSLYGFGDSCSSYGNRNFWRDYTDWFGSTRAGAPAATWDWGHVVSLRSTVEMRSGTSTSRSSVGVARAGSNAVVLTVKGLWSKVVVGTSAGWVQNRDLEETSRTLTLTRMIVTSPVDLRSGTTASSSFVDTLEAGTAVIALDEKDGWTKVTVGNIAGWMSTADVTDATWDWGDVVTVAATVDLLSGTSTSKSSVGVAKAGANAVVLSVKGLWSKVVVGTSAGWVQNRDLEETSRALTLTRMTVTSSVELRSGTSTTSRSVEVLEAGTEVIALDEKDGWTKVTVGNIAGWMPADQVTDATWDGGDVVTVPATVELRSGTSTSKRSVGVADAGANAVVLSVKGLWSKVVVGTSAGWVQNSDLEETSRALTLTRMTVTSSVELRSGTSTSNRLVDVLEAGTEVIALDEKDGWTKVTVGNIAGWMLTGTDEETPAEPADPAAVEKGQIVTVTSAVHLRTGTSTSNRSLGVLSTGTRATVLGSKGEWHKIVTGNVAGWSHEDYLAPTTEVRTVQTMTLTSSQHLRTGTTGSNRSLGVLDAGTRVVSFATKGAWHKVVAGNIAGWLHGDHLE